MAKEIFYEVWIEGTKFFTTESEKWKRSESHKTEYQKICALRERFIKEIANRDYEIYKVVTARFDKVPKIDDRYKRYKRQLKMVEPEDEHRVSIRPEANYTNKSPFGIAS